MREPRERAAGALPILLASLLLAACGGGNGGGSSAGASADASGPGPSAPESGPAESPTASAGGTAEGSAEPSPGEGEFINPVIDRGFFDPFILEGEDAYYAYASSDRNVNIPAARSEDLVEWEWLSEVLPKRPLWTSPSVGRTWAPEVARTSAGYVMYYTSPDVVNENRQCISIAIAASPEGDFVDESREPFLCQHEMGGTIDPHHFIDEDGTPYLLYKNDGNAIGQRTKLWIQELSEDGLELVGEPIDLGLENDGGRWEGPLIEAPTLVLQDGTYYLFYSANAYDTVRYAVGYATSDTVTGPYVDAEENPILVSKGNAAGPGHQDVVADKDGDLWMVYHAWQADKGIGDYSGAYRGMWIDELVFENGKAIVRGPDVGPQPVP